MAITYTDSVTEDRSNKSGILFLSVGHYVGKPPDNILDLVESIATLRFLPLAVIKREPQNVFFTLKYPPMMNLLSIVYELLLAYGILRGQ